MEPYPGLFISMEGPDGSGKSLQLRLLSEALEKAGYPLLTSREPGGTPIGEKIRDILLSPESSAMSPLTEALLYAASRAQHVSEKIRPALSSGKVVLLDRYIDSSLVYQGIGRGLGTERVEALNDFAAEGLWPDITFLVYTDYETGLSRKALQEGHSLDRLESAGDAFHRTVNEGYLHLKDYAPGRVRLIDGTQEIGKIHRDIYSLTLEALSQKGIRPINHSKEVRHETYPCDHP